MWKIERPMRFGVFAKHHIPRRATFLHEDTQTQSVVIGGGIS